MGRKASVRFCDKQGCWVTSALGETRTTKTGRTYKPTTAFHDLRTPQDRSAALLRLEHLLAQEKLATPQPVFITDISFRQLSEFFLQDCAPNRTLGCDHQEGQRAEPRALRKMVPAVSSQPQDGQLPGETDHGNASQGLPGVDGGRQTL